MSVTDNSNHSANFLKDQWTYLFNKVQGYHGGKSLYTDKVIKQINAVMSILIVTICGTEQSVITKIAYPDILKNSKKNAATQVTSSCCGKIIASTVIFFCIKKSVTFTMSLS